MKRLFHSIVALLLLGSPAFAQSTKAQLNTEITSNYPDNTTGLITPSILRTTSSDFVASWQQAPRVNAQTGTTYTFVVGDYGQLVTFSNANPVAVTLPQATGTFATWNVIACNQGAGTVTITPTVSTIGGASTLALAQNQCRTIISDATNYQVTTGSIQPQTCSASNWVNAITASYLLTCSQPAFTDISGILALNKGGTAANLTASNGGIVWSTGSAMAILAGTATANLPLLSGATATPSWAAITYPSSATSGGIPYFSSTSAMASSGALTANGPVLGGGAGGAPTSMVAGTNGQVIVGQSGGAPLWKTVSGDITFSAAGAATVSSVNGVAYPASPTSNTVAVVTSANQTTYEAVPNAALANSTITLNAGTGVGLTVPGSMALGSTNTIGSTADTPRFAGLGLGGAANTRALRIYGASSGFQDFDVATAAGSGKITWPAGTTDFTATGGASQVVKQVTTGAPFTVGQLAFSDLSSTLAAAQVGTGTITGQTLNNSPTANNDYFLYYSASANAIQKCTIAACSSAAVAGVSSLNGLTGGLSVAGGTGLSISAGGTTVTVGLSSARQTLPTICAGFAGGTCPTSGTDNHYTTPANVLWVEFKFVGGGGGGGGGNNGSTSGTDGGSTCLKASTSACSTPLVVATGGGSSAAGGVSTLGTPGTCTGANVQNSRGPAGIAGNSQIGSVQNGQGGNGGNSYFGGAGYATPNGAAVAAAANSGSGGAGGYANSGNFFGGNGGASGGFCDHIINNPGSDYYVTIGAKGTGATGGTSGQPGSDGGAGAVISIEHYGT